MARNRQRAKARKQKLHRENIPGALDHASGEVEEVEAAIVAGAGGEPVDADGDDVAGAVAEADDAVDADDAVVPDDVVEPDDALALEAGDTLVLSGLPEPLARAEEKLLRST